MLKSLLQIAICTMLLSFAIQSEGRETFYRNSDFASAEELNDQYTQTIKPILDRRCVVCHSCAEAPCQLKLESPEGIERGANKLSARSSLVMSQPGMRLFRDAEKLSDWRRKGFYSVLAASPMTGHSVMLDALIEGQKPQPTSGPDQTLPTKIKGMPFKTAPLDFNLEYTPLVSWLSMGAPLPKAEDLEKIKRSKYPDIVRKWEDFFNSPSNKAKWSARYLYEHLFETHFYIDEAPGEFFELVRSRSKSPDRIQIISSRHEYDSPVSDSSQDNPAKSISFYYRLRKIHSSIVLKNHIVYHVNDSRLARLKELFWASNWGAINENQEFNFEKSNPFVAFNAIPAQVRYTWMLENSEMLLKLIMSGPNCRVSNAGSMIWDNYLALFIKPESDATVRFGDFFSKAVQSLPLPNFTDGFNRYMSQYVGEQINYAKVKRQYQNQLRPNGLLNSDIWTGDGIDPNSIISIFRHIDYASAHSGHMTNRPRSVHLFDYGTFERLYYLCVVATTIQDSGISQLPVVRYLFDLKKELDEQFLSLIPENYRDQIRNSYVELAGKQYDYNVPFALPYNKLNKTLIDPNDPFQSFVTNFLKDNFSPRLLGINSIVNEGFKTTELVKVESINQTPAGVAAHFPEITYLKVIEKDGSSHYFTLLVNRYHSFLNRVLTDKNSWDPKRDTFEVLNDIQIDFVNKIFVVNAENLNKFIDDIKGVSSRDGYLKFDRNYAVQKTDSRFWKVIDELQAHIHQAQPISAGILDLHKYGKNDLEAPGYSEAQ